MQRELHRPSYVPGAGSVARDKRLFFNSKLVKASKNNTFVTPPAGDAFAVQIFEQRDGVFAGDAGQFFKRGHGDSLTFRLFVRGKLQAQFSQRVAMKD